MPRLRARAAAAIAAGLLLPALLHAQMGASMGRGGGNPMFKPGPGPDDLWEMTVKMEMPGMPMALPDQTSQVCVRKGRKDADLVPQNDECTMTDVRTSGNRTTFAMVCKGDPPMSGTGDITSTPTSYHGRIAVRSTRRGEEMTMTQTFTGKRIGTCTDVSEQFVAKVEADAKAMTTKQCAEMMDSLTVQAFEPGGPCAAQRRQFCDRAAAVAAEMREPAGHSAARRKYGASLQPALRGCNQDYAAVSASACAKAVAARNWNFVGSGPCDDDVRANGPRYCNTGPNRSPDPQYFGLCSRYAALTRGTAAASADAATGSVPGGTAGAPAPAAPPAQPDPIRQGVDAVRKLLPF